MARHVGKYYACCVCQNLVCGVYASTCGVYASTCGMYASMRDVYVKIVCEVYLKTCAVCLSKSCVLCMSISCVVWCKTRARCERQNVLCARQNVFVYVKIRTSFSCYCYMRWNQCTWFEKMTQNQNLHIHIVFFYKNRAYKNIRLWWPKS